LFSEDLEVRDVVDKRELRLIFGNEEGVGSIPVGGD
jgi:hypothetical protein